MGSGLIAAGQLLHMALGGIVGGAASEGAKRLWRIIRNRLLQNQPIEAEIVELEQNPTQKKLKFLEPLLEMEMRKDKIFAKEISQLAREITNINSGDNITIEKIKAETGGVAAAKINAPNSRIGGSDINLNLGKN